eukprot:COSAG04_NODE_26702_length_291_cov_1.932292_1_plen_44_part_01
MRAFRLVPSCGADASSVMRTLRLPADCLITQPIASTTSGLLFPG